MSFLSFDSIVFDAQQVEFLSLSLLHSVWQGCLVATVAAMGFTLLRRAPDIRYVWGVFCLALLVASPIVTFRWLQSQAELEPISSAAAITLPLMQPWYPESAAGADAELPSTAHAHVPYPWATTHVWVVGFWCVGQLLLGGRLLFSAYFVYRLKTRAVAVSAEIERVAERLATQMGVPCPWIASSEFVNGAMAAGFFRQIIVVPTAWLTDMTPDMLQAVIAHELAHLRRYDLWINLLQRLAEALLFYHPAVWWLSKKIRHDRELCCDLLAIHATKKRKLYAETLEHVARRESIQTRLLVTQIGADRMSLLRRVRLVLGQQPTPTSSGWWPAGLIAIAIPCACLWHSHSNDSYADERSETTAISPISAALPATAALPAAAQPADQSVLVPRPVSPDEYLTIARAQRATKRNAPKWILGDYVIEAPDVITIEAVNLTPREPGNEAVPVEAAITGEHLVGPDGKIGLGTHGRVLISGMTCESAKSAVEKRLATYFKNPNVVVNVLAYNSKWYYVILLSKGTGDQVIRIPVTGNEHVSEAFVNITDVVVTQGISVDELDVEAIQLKRPSKDGTAEKILAIDWEAISTDKSTKSNYQLLPGDRLFVQVKDFDHSGPVARFPEEAALLPSPYYQYDDVEIFTPQNNSATGPEQALADFDSQTQSKLAWNRRTYRHRIPIMAATTSGGQAKVLPAPSDKQILDLIRVGSPDSVLLQPQNRSKLAIQKQLVADYVDPVKTYPLIGKAQLHHAHYQCAVSLSDADPNVEGGKSKSKPQTFVIDHMHLHASQDLTDQGQAFHDREEPTKPSGEEKPKESPVYRTTYYVGDLVMPIQPPTFTKTGEQQSMKSVDPDFATLVNLITSTVAPNSWDNVGGKGSLTPFVGNLSLVVAQQEEVHEEIVGLLTQLRRLQESKFMLRSTTLELSPSLAQQLGLEGKLLSALSPAETKRILKEVHRDAHARTFPGLKATLFNGQFMRIKVGESGEEEVMLQGTVLDKKLRVAAGPVKSDSGAASELKPASITADQAFLVRIPDQKGAASSRHRFRLITGEEIETNAAPRILGMPEPRTITR